MRIQYEHDHPDERTADLLKKADGGAIEVAIAGQRRMHRGTQGPRQQQGADDEQHEIGERTDQGVRTQERQKVVLAHSEIGCHNARIVGQARAAPPGITSTLCVRKAEVRPTCPNFTIVYLSAAASRRPVPLSLQAMSLRCSEECG